MQNFSFMEMHLKISAKTAAILSRVGVGGGEWWGCGGVGLCVCVCVWGGGGGDE